MIMNYSDELSVKGKIALVTGAARGIGRACALALAEAGADVALGLRDVKSDSGLVGEIESLGRKVLPLQMDKRHPKSMQEWIASKKFLEDLTSW